jgi:isopenicillin-N epimerase
MEGPKMEQSRRDFLKVFGKATAGLGLASLTGVPSPLTSGVPTASACVGSGGIDWKEIRREYFKLSKDYIYMNNSTMGATLKPVSDRMAEVQEIFSDGCTLDRFFNEIVMALAPLRDKMKQIVKADTRPDSFGYFGKCVGNVDSVTEGMSFVANGLDLESGDVIIYTDHEHSGGRTMWELRRDRSNNAIKCGIPATNAYGTDGTMVPLIFSGDNELTWADNLVNRFIDTIEYNNGYRGKVKVVSFPWITTSTGHVLPAGDLCDRIKRIYPDIVCVIDGAQAFTVIPMDLQTVNCDFLVVNGHKYLCGPVGSGFVVVDQGQLDSGSGFWPTVLDDQVYRTSSPQSNAHRKSGISAYTNLLPLYDALTFYESLGAENVHARLFQIGDWLREGLSGFPDKFKLITPRNPDISCVMTCFQVIGQHSQKVYEDLKNLYNIQVKNSTEGFKIDELGYYPPPPPPPAPNMSSINGAVRIAPHYYNTEKEFKQLAKALCQIAGADYKSWPDFPS